MSSSTRAFISTAGPRVSVGLGRKERGVYALWCKPQIAQGVYLGTAHRHRLVRRKHMLTILSDEKKTGGE
ncbi:hypothetical protein JMJ77_0013169 [Colletotrichum scovillei]|uniref:Uncharacterized protein n=1 Tax=Colletotrichum scovillei TaxID=1209932 RepID=A0A9P7UCT5_9PEZI|nr:hypothetical protein JMJ77_0013169 [Colletotrichum scovillei]KAG7069462.1 hypothetical protein JMJ76_0003131 [Colletotrichum scovillei]KAG7073409.1 hypothetical protein JMJ78_0014385 [Colletotrichum scovillei]